MRNRREVSKALCYFNDWYADSRLLFMLVEDPGNGFLDQCTIGGVRVLYGFLSGGKALALLGTG